MRMTRRMVWIGVLAVLALAMPAWAGPKNVILMIADGASFNTFRAAEYFRDGAPGQGVYAGFPVRYACTTYALGGSYDPAAIWASFEGPKKGATDSAAAATALYTGVKTRNGRISVDAEGQPLVTIAELAEQTGRATGVVSSVPLSHATPAAVDAHNTSRNNYEQIAQEMITESGLDVIIGAGHPEFDDSNQPRPAEEQEFKFVGGQALWEQLRQRPEELGWTLVDDTATFQAIAAGEAPAPQRLLGVPRVASTLQSSRRGDRGPDDRNDVPELATLVQAALAVLATDPNGLLLVVEGGAIDWANHGNNPQRMLEEQLEFDAAVAAVVAWVEANGGWDDTLLIVTSDHDCGYVWGPDAGEPARFDEVVNNGPGVMPGLKHYSGGHTNLPVPLYARGAGAERFAAFATQYDPVYGPYVDNTDVAKVIQTVLQQAPVAATATDHPAQP